MLSPMINLQIPTSCKKCGFHNFNLWGTITNEKMKIEWRCMRCGKKNIEYEENGK